MKPERDARADATTTADETASASSSNFEGEAELDEFGWDADVDAFLRDCVTKHGEDWQRVAAEFRAELCGDGGGDGGDGGVGGDNDEIDEVFGAKALSARWSWLARGHTIAVPPQTTSELAGVSQNQHPEGTGSVPTHWGWPSAEEGGEVEVEVGAGVWAKSESDVKAKVLGNNQCGNQQDTGDTKGRTSAKLSDEGTQKGTTKPEEEQEEKMTQTKMGKSNVMKMEKEQQKAKDKEMANESAKQKVEKQKVEENITTKAKESRQEEKGTDQMTSDQTKKETDKKNEHTEDAGIYDDADFFKESCGVDDSDSDGSDGGEGNVGADDTIEAIGAALAAPAAAAVLTVLSNRGLVAARLGQPRGALRDAAAAITLATFWRGEAWTKVRDKLWVTLCRALSALRRPVLLTRCVVVAEAAGAVSTVAGGGSIQADLSPEAAATLHALDMSAKIGGGHGNSKADDVFAIEPLSLHHASRLQQRGRSAEDLRLSGNQAFKTGDNDGAMRFYSASLYSAGGSLIARKLLADGKRRLGRHEGVDALSLASAAVALLPSDSYRLVARAFSLAAKALLLLRRPRPAEAVAMAAHTVLAAATASAEAVERGAAGGDGSSGGQRRQWHAKLASQVSRLLEGCKLLCAEEGGRIDWAARLSRTVRAPMKDAGIGAWVDEDRLDENDCLDVADFVGPISVVEVPGKGRGLVATENLRQGQLVISCRAIAAAFGMEARGEMLGELAAALERGGAATRRVVTLLHRREATGDNEDEGAEGGECGICNSGGAESVPLPTQGTAKIPLPSAWDLLGRSEQTAPLPFLPAALEQSSVDLDPTGMVAILAANTLGRGGTDKGSCADHPVVGLWPLGAMCNHADKPNLNYSIHGHVLVLRAARGIKVGEELCISYTSWDATILDRAERLSEVWGIPAQVELAENSEIASEARLKVVPDWLRSFRASNGVAAAKEAIKKLCAELPVGSVGPSRATVLRLQAIYCLHERDVPGVLSALAGVATAAAESAGVGEHVVECRGAHAVLAFRLLGKSREASDALRGALEAVADLYGVSKPLPKRPLAPPAPPKMPPQTLADTFEAAAELYNVPGPSSKMTFAPPARAIASVDGKSGEVSGLTGRVDGWKLLFWRLRQSLWLSLLGYSADGLAAVEAEMRASWSTL
eukprot:TRINITY_DN61250_c0_g1_i1.p1 TRINITY_DN61250_c0_g1~~TRINITY_DN61250_c0_g1_i1.p1  ORF type:complete len:1158 (+),score=275.01 TRINITY_DN61250_c0_g1_i1:154-3627(+)